ncbi:MAG: endonuclease III domain-containing protein [Candidatus Odinarchaeota archaeon]
MSTPFKTINTVYDSLLRHYGKQGWWPLLDFKDNDENPTSSGILKNYHPGDYSLPATDKQRLEIIIGAYLVQHTSWRNTEQALLNLEKHDCLTVDGLNNLPVEKLAELIRPSRYYNQKARYLKHLAAFLKQQPVAELAKMKTSELQQVLLSLKGIGEETADSILCYAFKRPVFVVDLYTKIFFTRMGISGYDEKNENIKKKVDAGFLSENRYERFNEFHALIVEHAKQKCKPKKPDCSGCVFENKCPKILLQ